MKYLSYILALWVLLLSTAPCFLKDECLFQCKNDTQEETSTDDDGCSCTDCCCSPFLHCNTCTGCPAPKLFHSPFVTMIQLNDTPPFVLQGETDSAVLLFYLATTQDNESLIIYSRISLQWRYNYLFNSRRRRLYFTVGLLRIYSYCE